MARSAGVSTTRKGGPGRGAAERHSAQTSSSLKLLHLPQRCTLADIGERVRGSSAGALVLEE